MLFRVGLHAIIGSDSTFYGAMDLASRVCLVYVRMRSKDLYCVRSRDLGRP